MNFWPASAFWRNVGIAVLMAEAELIPMKFDPESIQRSVLLAWLEWAPAAGRA